MAAQAEPLVILLVDPEGQGSPIAVAALRAGHRLVVATGLDTAVAVLTSFAPDVVVVRQSTPEHDRRAVARLSECAPEAPIRLVDAAGALEGALGGASVPLN
jgi:hypothetical protein